MRWDGGGAKCSMVTTTMPKQGVVVRPSPTYKDMSSLERQNESEKENSSMIVDAFAVKFLVVPMKGY